MILQSIAIKKLGGRSFLEVGGESIEILDYKISSSMRGSTELEVTFLVGSCEVMGRELAATKEEFLGDTEQGQRNVLRFEVKIDPQEIEKAIRDIRPKG